MDGSRALQGAPGVFLEALEVSRGAFWMIFLVLGGTGSENGEMLESDNLLNENARFGTRRRIHWIRQIYRKWCTAGSSDPRFLTPEARMTVLKQTSSNQKSVSVLRIPLLRRAP